MSDTEIALQNSIYVTSLAVACGHLVNRFLSSIRIVMLVRSTDRKEPADKNK